MPKDQPKTDTKDVGYRVFHNLAPLPGTMPQEMVKANFARRLYREMVQKGWNQSVFARETRKHTPDGAAGVTRDLVSKYIGAKVIPSSVNMDIIVKTLGVTREDLLPAGAVPEAGSDSIPPFDVRDAGNGIVWLRVNQAVDQKLALKIMSLLFTKDKGE